MVTWVRLCDPWCNSHNISFIFQRLQGLSFWIVRDKLKALMVVQKKKSDMLFNVTVGDSWDSVFYSDTYISWSMIHISVACTSKEKILHAMTVLKWM